MAPWYPECAATPEQGPIWEPPTIGGEYTRRLREAVDPNAAMATHKAAKKFHQKMAEKAGIDTPRGLAHLGLMKRHMSAINKHKQNQQMNPMQTSDTGPSSSTSMPSGVSHSGSTGSSPPVAGTLGSKAGRAGRENPVTGIPSKKDQPSEDIRQDKPLIRLRQKKEAIESFGLRRVKKAPRGMVAKRRESKYVADRYDDSHDGKVHESRRTVRESRRLPAGQDYEDEHGELGSSANPIHLSNYYKPAQRKEGWDASGQIFTPPAQKVQESTSKSRFLIKEF